MSETQRPVERSPRGIAKWVTLNQPDTKFKKEGEYRVVLKLTGADAAKLQARIDEGLNLAVVEGKAKNPKVAKSIKVVDRPYKADTDKEGNETGATLFTFKAKASGERKDKTIWTFRPAIFDGALQPIDVNTVKIGWGSELVVAFEMRPYGTDNYNPKSGVGVSLKMAAVQILKLKSGATDAASFGFEATEASAEEMTNEAPAGAATADSNEEF